MIDAVIFLKFLCGVFDLVREWRHQFCTYGIKVKGYFLDDDEAKVPFQEDPRGKRIQNENSGLCL